mmetsp:Transcript_15164/g.22513  ORF Transcript_15164/g.22513 Transcript_15164/m.22513 type:complete len:233 (-) Transcript_15164:42-740(-)
MRKAFVGGSISSGLKEGHQVIQEKDGHKRQQSRQKIVKEGECNGPPPKPFDERSSHGRLLGLERRCLGSLLFCHGGKLGFVLELPRFIFLPHLLHLFLPRCLGCFVRMRSLVDGRRTADVFLAQGTRGTVSQQRSQVREEPLGGKAGLVFERFIRCCEIIGAFRFVIFRAFFFGLVRKIVIVGIFYSDFLRISLCCYAHCYASTLSLSLLLSLPLSLSRSYVFIFTYSRLLF